MDIRTLNERTHQHIENVLENPKNEEKVIEETYYKSLYSPATLINDWSERRKDNEVLHTTQIPLLSENMDKYRRPCSTTFPERKEYFNMIFDSYGCGKELLLDHLGFSYYGNYVTSYDLCYNHLTKGICGPYPRRYHKGVYKPVTDLTLIYGNLTQWGLKERVYKSMKTGTFKEMEPVSESKAEYVIHDLAEVNKINDFPKFKKIKVFY